MDLILLGITVFCFCVWGCATNFYLFHLPIACLEDPKLKASWVLALMSSAATIAFIFVYSIMFI